MSSTLCLAPSVPASQHVLDSVIWQAVGAQARQRVCIPPVRTPPLLGKGGQGWCWGQLGRAETPMAMEVGSSPDRLVFPPLYG